MSGLSPKLGADGVKTNIQATNSGGTWPSLKSTTPLNTMAVLEKYLVAPIKVGNNMTTVLQNAGVGKITV